MACRVEPVTARMRLGQGHVGGVLHLQTTEGERKGPIQKFNYVNLSLLLILHSRPVGEEVGRIRKNLITAPPMTEMRNGGTLRLLMVRI
jgi:hypothetical protein